MYRWPLMMLATVLVACQPAQAPSNAETAEVPATEAGPDNGDIVKNMYAAFAAGDVETVLASMSPDIVWNEAENFPYADGNPYVGPQAVVEGVFTRLGGEWEYFHVIPEEFIAAGDRVVMLGRYDAKYKATGKTMNPQVVHVWRVENGLATRFQQYVDTAQVQAILVAD